MTNIFQAAAAALEQARTITPTERRVLQALRDRGPGLPLEVAMRVLSFPEQIAPVLRSLQERGLARAERFGGSALGDELWTITPLGVQTLEAAQALAQRSVSPPASEAASAPRSVSPLEVLADMLRPEASEAASAPRSVSPPAPAEAPRDVASSLQQEADLLRKLGELAEKRGDTQQAARYYEEALGLIRKSREPSTD
jgi:DNA-binding PadR family transcriptional regulator